MSAEKELRGQGYEAAMISLKMIETGIGRSCSGLYAGGMLDAVATHLVKVCGPRATYEALQRVADRVSRPLVDGSQK